MSDIKCPLCNSSSKYYITFRNKDYYMCEGCKSIFMDSKFYLDPEKEKDRYLLHNNDVDDLGYQKFVKPIIDYTIDNFTGSNPGLDFGAGHGPVISTLLKRMSYDIEMYDPFFHNQKELLKKKYDYIISCEVIEHFHNPAKEFLALKQMLNSGGKLILKTDILKPETDFSKWYYKNDSTHVFFYSIDSFDFIVKHFGFSKVFIDDRLIIIEV